MPIFALTIFVAAFLLFQIQPMVGKILLPWFGGGAGVWTVCLLFFQVALLLGYAYADLLQRLTRGRTQIITHLVILVLSALWMPIGASRARLEDAQAYDPTWGVLLVLLLTIGLPYAVLASTSPLMQKWFALAQPGRSPYRLYALSNLGSVLALVTFPFLFEPRFATQTQTLAWSGLYLLFLASVIGCGVTLWKRGPHVWPDKLTTTTHDPADARPSLRLILFWLALAAVGSLTLMSATNFLTLDIAPLPLLWVLPLALYLVSFIIAFEYERLYQRWVFIPLLVLAVFLNNLLFHQASQPRLIISAGICLLALFAICMVCHGELARSKPAPRHLTFFYLVIAAGGALGGITVAFLAPVIFQDYWEYHAGLLAAWLLALIAVARIKPARPREDRHIGTRGVVILGSLPLLALALSFGVAVWADRVGAIVIARNFYGSFRVEAFNPGGSQAKRIRHGTTDHGFQFMDEQERRRPAGYYGPLSGLGLALRHFPQPGDNHPKPGDSHPPALTSRGLHLGVVGLGTGTTAAYLDEGDTLRFYEINPKILELAEDHFTYLADASARGAHLHVVLGDARIELEREFRDGGPQNFDILAVDAFSSDAIPMHLLTAEAGDTYWRHLQPHGVLAIHISNRHLDLLPVVRALADRAGKTARLVSDPGYPLIHGTYRTNWVLITDNQPLLEKLDAIAGPSTGQHPGQHPVAWTDDFASIWSVLGFNRMASAWDTAPLKGYYALDQARLFTPRQNHALGDQTRALHIRSRGQAIVIVLTIDSIQAAAVNAADDLTLQDFGNAYLSVNLRDTRPVAGYLLLHDRSTNHFTVHTFDRLKSNPALTGEALSTAAQPVIIRTRDGLDAGRPPRDVIWQAAQDLIRITEQRAAGQ